MGYDFNKYLKTYVNIFDISDYVEDKDRLAFDKIEEILETMFGEKIFEIVALKMDEEDYQFTNIFVAYDSKEHPFEIDYVTKMTMKVFNEFGFTV